VVMAIVLAVATQASVLGLAQSVSKQGWMVVPLYLAAFAPIIAGAYIVWRQPETRWGAA